MARVIFGPHGADHHRELVLSDAMDVLGQHMSRYSSMHHTANCVFILVAGHPSPTIPGGLSVTTPILGTEDELQLTKFVARVEAFAWMKSPPCVWIKAYK